MESIKYEVYVLFPKTGFLWAEPLSLKNCQTPVLRAAEPVPPSEPGGPVCSGTQALTPCLPERPTTEPREQQLLGWLPGWPGSGGFGHGLQCPVCGSQWQEPLLQTFLWAQRAWRHSACRFPNGVCVNLCHAKNSQAFPSSPEKTRLNFIRRAIPKTLEGSVR